MSLVGRPAAGCWANAAASCRSPRASPSARYELVLNSFFILHSLFTLHSSLHEAQVWVLAGFLALLAMIPLLAQQNDSLGQVATFNQPLGALK